MHSELWREGGREGGRGNGGTKKVVNGKEGNGEMFARTRVKRSREKEKQTR